MSSNESMAKLTEARDKYVAALAAFVEMSNRFKDIAAVVGPAQYPEPGAEWWKALAATHAALAEWKQAWSDHQGAVVESDELIRKYGSSS